MLQLTEEQNNAIATVMKLFAQGNVYTKIIGSAGTGKTTLACELIRQLREQDYQCYLTAPTNKAAKVLASKVGDEAKTIHKLLRLVLVDVEDKQALVGRGVCKFNPRHKVTVVIDEASMLNNELMELIHKTVKANPKVQVLFIGDPYQLPPIGEEYSEAFEYSGPELKTVMRQAEENSIITLATALRNAQAEQSKIPWKDFTSPDVIMHKTSKDFYDSYINDFYAGLDTHIVAWRNRTVNSSNDRVRNRLYGDDAMNPFLVGEEVMLYEPVLYHKDSKSNDDTSNVMMHNSELADVVSVTETVEHVKGTVVDSYCVALRSKDDVKKECIVFVPQNLPAYYEALNILVTRAKNAKDAKSRNYIFTEHYYPLKNYFTEIRPSHTITTHKSQGSTYDSVYVLVNDIQANRNKLEMLQSLYVAITRASGKVHLYGAR